MRTNLEQIESIVYSGIVPYTSREAVNMASEALKIKQESTTTDEEIAKIVSTNLQI